MGSDEIEEIVRGAVVLVPVLLLFFSWLYYNKARHAERILLIEKGFNIDEHYKSGKIPWLKVGIVILGLSTGLGIIAVLNHLFGVSTIDTHMPFTSGTADLAIFGVCAGISFIIAHYIDKKSL